ncbi:MAG: hypothetical protein QOF29_3310 [bacterium]|jgi:hypothetical protein
MDPIASILGQQGMRRALTGAAANDPVVPEPTPRLRHRPSATRRRIDATRRLAAAVARASGEREGRVHIHMGDGGRPYVCEASRCTSPGMSPRDL